MRENIFLKAIQMMCFCAHRMDTLQRHMPLSGQDGMTELLKIAARFEEKIFFAATDQV